MNKICGIYGIRNKNNGKIYIGQSINVNSRFIRSRSVVTRISNGTRWANITGGAVIPVSYKDGVRVFSDSHKERIGKSHRGMKYKEKYQ